MRTLKWLSPPARAPAWPACRCESSCTSTATGESASSSFRWIVLATDIGLSLLSRLMPAFACVDTTPATSRPGRLPRPPGAVWDGGAWSWGQLARPSASDHTSSRGSGETAYRPAALRRPAERGPPLRSRRLFRAGDQPGAADAREGHLRHPATRQSSGRARAKARRPVSPRRRHSSRPPRPPLLDGGGVRHRRERRARRHGHGGPLFPFLACR